MNLTLKYSKPFTNNNEMEHSLSISREFCKFESNTTFDWLDQMV